MAYPSVSYTFTNGTVADGANVSTNFSNLVSGLSDGTKDLNMNAATFAGNLTANGNIVLGNASSDTIALTGIITLGLLSTLTVPIGAAATPSLNFTSSTTTGLSCATADTLVVSTAATARLTFSSAGLITVGTGGVIANVLGGLAVPSYSFTGDLNTGMWSSGADTINFSLAGEEKLRIESTGPTIFGTGDTTRFTIYGTTTPGFQGFGFGGSYASPTASALGQALVLISGRGYGTGFTGTKGSMAINAEALWSATSNPTYIAFSTTPVASTSPAERLRIASDGIITITAGIKFPATQAASSDVNTLDDYEEGTWTPTLGGTATYGANHSGYYTKIGNLVTIRARIYVNVLGTGATNTCAGLPFTSNASVVMNSALSIGYFSGLVTNIVSLYASIPQNGTTIYFYSATSAQGTLGASNVFQNGALIDISGSYTV